MTVKKVEVTDASQSQSLALWARGVWAGGDAGAPRGATRERMRRCLPAVDGFKS